MINSCTGKMGQAVADAAVRAGLTLAPYTLCSKEDAASRGTVEVAGGQQLELVGPSNRDAVIEQVGGAACVLGALRVTRRRAQRLRPNMWQPLWLPPCMHIPLLRAPPPHPNVHWQRPWHVAPASGVHLNT
jgi:hypothetical protein